jgi:very-short-patch-repair endonuclease
VDGGYHAQYRTREYGLKRTEKLEALGYNVIRFKNKLIFYNLGQVLETIKEAFREN